MWGFDNHVCADTTVYGISIKILDRFHLYNNNNNNIINNNNNII